MPCDKLEHDGKHYWPDEGMLTVWPCERVCAFCHYVARDSTNLRNHIRDTHCGDDNDKPKLSVASGRKNPGTFDTQLAKLAKSAQQQNGDSSPGVPQVNAGAEAHNTRKAAATTVAASAASTPQAVKESTGRSASKRKSTLIPDSEDGSPPKETPLRRGRRKRARTSRAIESVAADDEDDVDASVNGAEDHAAEPSPELGANPVLTMPNPAPLVQPADVPYVHPIHHIDPAYAVQHPTPASVALAQQAIHGQEDKVRSTRMALRTNLDGLLTFCENCGLQRDEIYWIVQDRIGKWIFKGDDRNGAGPGA